jgi:flavin reductase (DIM6/NTAB) family NADH-FMN oxidoreductase RutF
MKPVALKRKSKGENAMKKLGPVLGLYPTPVTIVGTVVDGKVNWANLAHVGIVGIDRILLSVNKNHHSNRGIQTNKTVSVNLVNESMLVEADYVGMVSGRNTDKSNVFEYFTGELHGAPLIKNASVAMECEVLDIIDGGTHDLFIVKPVNTYADENVLTTDGRIDFVKASPVLFDMPLRQYLSTGKVLAKCWDIGKQYSK